jgi:hypothetical protein
MRQNKELQGINLRNQAQNNVMKDQKSVGFIIRSGIRSGNWLCSSCEGKTEGSNLFQPKCQECVKI